MNFGENIRLEIAILADEKLNKYYPGVANFTLPIVTPYNASTTNQPISAGNNLNKSNISGIGTVTLGQTISLTVPKYITLDYKEKYIPKGTKFIVGFIANDNTKPFVLGMIMD